MSLPFLLLGLYFALLALAVGLCSWAGHSSPPPEEARRVTDAAARAGLGHLVAPLRLAGFATLLFTLMSGVLALMTGLPLKWFILGPLTAPLAVASILFYCARSAQKTAGQLVGLTGADAKLVLTGRSVLGLVLCAEAGLGLVVLGFYSLSLTDLNVGQARFLSCLIGSSIALFVVVFARATTSAQFASYYGTRNAPEGPHAGSLALLVSATFHSPLLKLAALVVLSTLGHCSLLLMDGLPEQSENLWLYPHLLKLLGLFGLLFAGLVVRTSEEETGGEGWTRGALVYLVLMVAGAWSLSSELPVAWARSIPAGLSFFYISLGLALWVATGTRAPSGGLSPASFELRSTNSAPPFLGGTSTSSLSLGSAAYRSLPACLLFLGLLSVLVFVTGMAPDGDTASQPGTLSVGAELPASTVTSLLLSGSVSALPIAFTWLIAQSLASGSQRAEELAYVGEARAGLLRTPSARLLLALPLLASVIVLSAQSVALMGTEPLDGLSFTIFGFGAFLGGLTLAGLLGHVEHSSRKATGEIALLLKDQESERERHPHEDARPINFETAVLRCRETTGARALPWLLLCLMPFGAAISGFFLIAPLHFQSLTLGLGTGATLLAVGILLLQGAEPDHGKRALAHLAFVCAVAQGLWLLATGSFPA